MWALSERRLRTTLLVTFIVLSWISLWAWSRTTYSQHFHHAAGGSVIFQPDLRPILSFALGWALMTVAMMLPTSFPLLGLFRTLVSDRKYRASLVALCIAGYLAIWVFFGMLANIGVSQLSPFVTQLNFQIALLLVAGIYQFTPLKHYCLQKCRSPLSFINQHWHGKNEVTESFWLGAHHGLFCIGCCWSLMLLMFLAVAVHMLWMLMLSTVMAIEKNMTWGSRISAPLGVVLILAAVVLKLVS